MTAATVQQTVTCPAWCNDHGRFDDGSDDWHRFTTDDGEVLVTAESGGEPEIWVGEGSIDRAKARRIARDLLAAASVADTIVSDDLTTP